MTRAVTRRGQATVLIVGFAVVLLMAIAMVVDASAAYLQRQGLDTVADGAALRGADLGATAARCCTAAGSRRRTGSSSGRGAARAAVRDYLRATGAYAAYPGLSFSVDFDAGDGQRHRARRRAARPAAHRARLARASGDRGSRLRCRPGRSLRDLIDIG